MPSVNVELTQHWEEFIASLVAAGVYQDADEVIRDGLRLLERDRRVFEARLQALRDAVQVGWDDEEAGRYTEVTSEAERAAVWEEIDRRADALLAARAARRAERQG